MTDQGKSERPLAELLETYWFGAGVPEGAGGSDGSDGPDALDRLGRPDINVRGRNLREVLRPAYDALQDKD